MRLRLTYDGKLRPSQLDPLPPAADKLAAHKHSIRQHFHAQLRHLWQTDQALKSAFLDWWPDDIPPGVDPLSVREMLPLKETLARRHTLDGFRFVPLRCAQTLPTCSLDIVFLRRDAPGSIMQAGDLDNRIKTLIDGLRKPKTTTELAGHTPGPDEEPFYCLLEDDNIITNLRIETDTLLRPPVDTNPDQDVHLMITVS